MDIEDDLTFVPIRKASGWSITDGTPRAWWWGRLEEDEKLTLTHGGDARTLDARIDIFVGTATTLGQTMRRVESREELSWGYLACDTQEDELLLDLSVSRGNFDRIVCMLETVGPPGVTIGFCEDSPGPITEHEDGYRWDPAAGYLNVKTCAFRYVREAPQDEVEAPEGAPKLLRGLGAGFTVAISLVALFVAIEMFGAAGSKFETATVSVLLLIYVNGVTSSGFVGRALIQIEVASIARFLSLRRHFGVPISPEEQKYLTIMSERSGRPGLSYWITTATNSIIALLAGYHLIALLG